MLAHGFQTRPLDPYVLDLEQDWERWVRTLFPQYTSWTDGVPVPFGNHHRDYWRWLWAIKRGIRPDPFWGIWGRGGAKSTNAEMGSVSLGARRVRRYLWYISETQDQADDHVGTIGDMLESTAIEQHYPDLADRAVGKYGTSKGWRRNRLWTAAGFTIDALGLDVAARGAKLEEQRPDGMIFDDIDGETDTVATTEKKITIITRKLLPAGAPDCAVLGIQNLVLPDGVFAQVADGRADFLRGRILSGPIPAIRDLEVERQDGRYVIVGGRASWAGQDLDRCQEQINEWGLSAFLAEAQHEVEAPPGGMFDHIEFKHCTQGEVPWEAIILTTVWVDPAVTNTDRSDAMGIQVDGLAQDGTIYRFHSWEQRASPLEALKQALRKAIEYQSHMVGVETDQGGDTWQAVFWAAWRELEEAGEIPPGTPQPQFVEEKAGAGEGPKVHRAHQVLAEYERDRFVHVQGTHVVLERALKRFPKTKPLDLVDAGYWSWKYLNSFRFINRHATAPLRFGAATRLPAGSPLGGAGRPARTPAGDGLAGASRRGIGYGSPTRIPYGKRAAPIGRR